MRKLVDSISIVITKKTTKFCVSILCICFTIVIITNIVYIYHVNKIHKEQYEIDGEYGIRKFPYPYKAALTIASDIDRTDTVDEFLEIQEFINTKNMTKLGEGVELEIGNSFFMFPTKNNPGPQFAYFTEGTNDRVVITRFIESGLIDFFHSWGEGFRDRNSAQIALDELEQKGLKLKVWVNHADNRSNFGKWDGYGYGDDKETEYYHADLTIRYGVKYVWIGSSTWIIGQSTPMKFSTLIGSYDSRYPIKSLSNLCKAVIKQNLSAFRMMRNKYALHASNTLVSPVVLDDGQKVYQFNRYDNHYGGIGVGAFASTMHYNLSERVINQLVKARGFAVLYAHLGKNEDCESAIPTMTRDALRYISSEFQNGNVYVTTTQKLLDYYIYSKYLDWTYEEKNDKIVIRIQSVKDPVFGEFIPDITDLQGITFYVPDSEDVRIFIGEGEVLGIVRNQPDETQRESVTIPFTYSKYPKLEFLASPRPTQEGSTRLSESPSTSSSLSIP